jgi:hypothetical protein
VKILQHSFFWLASLCLLTLLFGQDSKDYIQSFYFASLLLPIAMGTSYFFNYFLLPNYLFKRRFFWFAVYFIYSIVISLYLEMLVTIGAFILMANYQFEEMNPLTVNTVTMGIAIYFIVFLSAFAKLIKHYFIQENTIGSLEKQQEVAKQDQIQIRVDRKNQIIKLDNLLYIESLADYVKVHTTTDQHITKERISRLEAELPPYFIRTHRSFLINSKKIDTFSKESLTVAGTELPISRSYKKAVINFLMQD